jgi:NAD(P)-dependent dehydrogenase (short-subunit alcohol dehydrogenase family)
MRHVIITGANRGIGLGLAKYFVEGGDLVVATCRNPDKAPELKALARECPERCRIETLDVSSALSVSGFAKQCQQLKVIDVLINNAGVLLDRGRAFVDLDLDVVSATMAVNTVAPMRVTQSLLPLLIKSSRPIVASITSKMGSIEDNTSGGYYAYRMSKTALNMFCKCFSTDFPNVISMVLHPGWVQTDMGGSQAPTTIAASAKGLGTLIDRCTKEHSGGFFDFNGERIPW